MEQPQPQQQEEQQQQQQAPPRWTTHWEQLGRKMGMSLDRMFQDSAAAGEGEDHAAQRAFNMFLMTTGTGRLLLGHKRIMLCPNNPFRIAALLIARKRLRMHKLTRRTSCPLPTEEIEQLVGHHLPTATYLDPANAAIMDEALEHFVVHHTAGTPYGATVAIRLW
ncbi:hypothetical protein [Medusavirus stheno T3]|uniref:Uncharacterized protein n=1 Tax=Medusavirus stheno T3 TaxID=3069717 RepID=A0A7S7YG50_9VIRU|nr:hypothetical protein QKU73_gp200 [Acanthamoeba castellanii medusavirus]QPB44575.1 hypothetical protein [Medusavirus stheno T3]